MASEARLSAVPKATRAPASLYVSCAQFSRAHRQSERTWHLPGILAWIFHKLALYRCPEWGQCPGGWT